MLVVGIAGIVDGTLWGTERADFGVSAETWSRTSFSCS